MMETEEKYKVVIVDDERTAIDALRRELEPYREFEAEYKSRRYYQLFTSFCAD